MMGPRFFDSSALVKRYTPEPGSEIVERAFEPGDAFPSATSWNAVLEVMSVLVRKRNDGRLPRHLFAAAAARLEIEVAESSDFTVRLATVPDNIAALALVTRHGINASDALILESARRWFSEVGAGEFWTSDRRLVRAARAEGILVVDPANPPPELPPETPRASPSVI